MKAGSLRFRLKLLDVYPLKTVCRIPFTYASLCVTLHGAAADVLTVHFVTFGVPNVETRGLHVGRQHIPPFVLVAQHWFGACRTLYAR